MASPFRMGEQMTVKKDTIKAVIIRDYWDDAGERQPEGKVIEVTKDALIAGMEDGILARFKDA